MEKGAVHMPSPPPPRRPFQGHPRGPAALRRDITGDALAIVEGVGARETPFYCAGKSCIAPAPVLGWTPGGPSPGRWKTPPPPIGVAGVSKGSDTLKLAGEHGFLPMSLNLNPGYVASHWDSVEEGARRSGKTPSRADWRLVREIFVADTDEEAWRLSVGAQMGRMMREYFLPLLKNVGVIQFLKHDEAVADSDVTPEYCATHNWLIGSPATVVEKIERMYDEVGGFGSILLFCFDYSENPDAWHQSMRLLAEEVMPKVAHLSPKN